MDEKMGRARKSVKWVWIVVAAVILCAIVIVLCATNAKPSADQTDLPQQTEQPEPPPRQFGPDQIYVPERCLYMNPLSSVYPGPDSGFLYRVGDGGFTMIRQNAGEEFPLVEGYGWAKWEEFPWNEQEWEALFWPDGMWAVDISGYEKREYCALSQDQCLLKMDGELWLADINEGPKIDTHVWSIYQLVPQSAKGAAQWEFNPILSSREPCFRFEFDVEGGELSVSCVVGDLSEPDGQTVKWYPMDKDGVTATEGAVYFAINQDETTACSGTVYIQGHRVEESGNWICTATVVGTDLVMEQNPDGGAIIRVK